MEDQQNSVTQEFRGICTNKCKLATFLLFNNVIINECFNIYTQCIMIEGALSQRTFEKFRPL